jgi:hypothetical protein
VAEIARLNSVLEVSLDGSGAIARPSKVCVRMHRHVLAFVIASERVCLLGPAVGKSVVGIASCVGIRTLRSRRARARNKELIHLFVRRHVFDVVRPVEW